MKCQILLSRINKKNISKCRLLKFLPSMQSVNDSRFKTWVNHCSRLTLKAPITTAAYDIFLNFFFIFQRKQVLTFHVSCLLGRQFTWNVKTCFLWKKKKLECCLLQILLDALRVKALKKCTVLAQSRFSICAASSKNMTLSICKLHIFRSSCACAKYCSCTLYGKCPKNSSNLFHSFLDQIFLFM